MSLTTKTFAEIVTFSRAGGATRFNSVGNLVGVDFSATSLAVATGSKAFTLAAAASNDRDWPVGSAVLATATEGTSATMTGVVSSYVPSTQVLTIAVASITGSGTGTQWRIGSLEKRLDFDPATLLPKGLLVEEQYTEAFIQNTYLAASFHNTAAGFNDITPVLDSKLGYAFEVEAKDAKDGYYRLFSAQPFGATTASPTWRTMYAKKVNCRYISIRTAGGWRGVTLDFDTGAIVTSGTGGGGLPTSGVYKVQAVGDGWYKFGWYAVASAVDLDNFYRIGYGNTLTATDANTGISSSIGDKVRIAYPSMGYTTRFEQSPVPTLAAQITRSPDLPVIDGARFAQIFNPQEGTIYFDAVRLSGNDAVTNGSGGSQIFGFFNAAATFNNQFVAGKYNGNLEFTFRDLAGSGMEFARVQTGLALPAANLPVKISISYKTGVGFKYSVNGVSGASSVPTLPAATWNRLDLARAYDATVGPKAIKNFRYYPRELTIAEQEALTA